MGTLTPSEFAEAVGVCQDTIYRWIKSKQIKVNRVGKRGHIRIPRNQLAKAGAVETQPRDKTPDEMAAELKAIDDLISRQTSR